MPINTWVCEILPIGLNTICGTVDTISIELTRTTLSWLEKGSIFRLLLLLSVVENQRSSIQLFFLLGKDHLSFFKFLTGAKFLQIKASLQFEFAFT